MANTIDWGQAAVNNTNGFGKAPTNNTIDFGEVCANSLSPETNLTGTGATPSFENTKSILLGGIDDYVSLASRTQNFTDFSLSFWCRSGGGNNKAIVGSSNTSQGGILTVISQRGGFIDYYDGSSGFTSLSGNISDGNWHHILITYNSTANTLKGYTDGSLSVTKTGVNPIATTNAHSFDNIGSYAGANYYNSSLDEIAVFSSVLSASDVSTIYGTGVPNDLSSLSPVHWWRCGDGDSAPTIVDNGSGGNDGTMESFSTFSTDVPT